MNKLLLLAGLAASAALARADNVAFQKEQGRLQITIGDKPFATYVYEDEEIRRPYLMHVHAPSGVQVTRNHPPIKGRDLDDHATFHPGIWLAFGDLGGADFWRNRGRVRQIEFTEEPKGGFGRGSFAVRNNYVGDRRICEETCRVTITVRPAGHLLICDSTFSSATQDFYFGDQEELGLGVRLATPLTVKNGGQILNSDGLKNEAQVWGKKADWCNYGGIINGQSVGVVIMPDPKNLRRSWFHARDYGLLVANPFGQNAFTKSEKSKVLVKKSDSFRLRFGVLIHGNGSGEPPDVQVAYRDFLEQIK